MGQSRIRMLIVNFAGLGNGLWTAPILRQLDEIKAISCYFHTANPIFNAAEIMRWLNLRKFGGTAPSGWRRFDRRDWAQICTFLTQNRINVVVNLRNEGPHRDTGYFDFKQEMAKSGLAFWDFDQVEMTLRIEHRLLLSDQISLLASNGIDVRGVCEPWLRDYVGHATAVAGPDSSVGFFTGASQEVKRWPVANWLELGNCFLRQTDSRVMVYAGQSEGEISLAQTVANGLRERFGAERCSIVAGRSFEQLVRDISALKLLVSNDTFAVHLGAAVGVPVVGLYFSTDAVIWGDKTDLFNPVQSRTGLVCPDFKSDAGNCTAFYGGCSGPCKIDVSVKRVWLAVRALAGKLRNSSIVSVQSISQRSLARKGTAGCLLP